MSEQRKKSNKLSIYLIKEDVKYDEILKDNVYSNVYRYDKNSVTYFLRTDIRKPEWLLTYFNDSQNSEISVARAKVISLHKLVIDGKERVFAIPFGNGANLLNDDVIEEQFGIKILLNSVTKDGFRQLRINNYGGDHRTKNEQTPKKTNINEFGFDVYSDFVSRATAKSDEELFNKNNITGGDILSVSVPVTIDDVENFLIECYKRYQSDKYKEDFGWLDNIKEVKDKKEKELLNSELVKNINKKNFDKVWAAVPEVIEWEEVSNFRYKLSGPGFDDIEIQQIISLFENGIISNVKTLKNRKVNAMNIDGDEPLRSWPLYKCLIADIEYDGCAYCLNFGKWYKLDKDFVKLTNDYYDSLELSDIKFPNSGNEREDEYNEKLFNSLPNSVLMDKKLIEITGMGKGSIEVCDVLTSRNELIHVKKNGGSSYLSHLFYQAAVSGEMLLDISFRNKINEKIGRKIINDNFMPSKYTVVIAMITKNKGDRPKIPFFSKVSIKYAIDGLVRKGYTVKIKNIQALINNQYQSGGTDENQK